MSYFTELKKFYPRTYKLRYAIQRYNTHVEWEGQDPSVTHCVFSKKQAVQAFIEYFEEYEIADQPSLGLTSTYSNYEVNFDNKYAESYPKQRPHYC
jgi:hypothetical protein